MLRNTPNFRLAENDDKSAVDLFIYDDIGPDKLGMIGGKTIADALAGVAKDATLNVHVNSVGGDVFEGMAIYNLLAQREGDVVVHVDGAALSAASLIAMAGDEIHMADNAMMMIHDPWIIVLGNPDELMESAAMLEKAAGLIAKTYSTRTGKAEADVRELMKAETWMTAEEAKAAGFVTHVTAGKGAENTSASAAVLERIRKMPERMAAMIRPRIEDSHDDPKPEPKPNPSPAAEPKADESAQLNEMRAQVAQRDAELHQARTRINELTAVVNTLRGEDKPVPTDPQDKSGKSEKVGLAAAVRFK